jgi:single-stranded-DNA-specific exonuclease
VSPRITRRSPPGGEALPGTAHPVLERVYRARGIEDPTQLDTSLGRLLPFHSLSGIAEASAVLLQALQQRSRVLVVGDFDADGATASALCMLGLRALGFAELGFLVPNRFDFGYGLSPEIVAVAQEEAPDLLITVDNGISSVEGVRAARDAGMQVVVTDHHLPGAELPDASAIVNPNLPGCGFPSKSLAGVGVMFYVLAALRAELVARGHFANAQAAPNLAAYLDLVALGTVADVVPLDANNRILVEQGLRRIRAGRCRPGISALLEVARRDPRRAVASDLGFAAAPRLNAAGRLTDMSLGIECLLEEDPDLARDMAMELDALNRERRDIEAKMQREAAAVVEGLDLGEGALPYGLCVYRPDWHQGVVGIVAARIRERYHRPTIAFAHDSEQILKGSARSVPGLHIRDALDAVAVAHPGLILKFGGHAMAAGLSLRADALPRFQQAFDALLREWLDAGDLEGVLLSDGALDAADLQPDTALTLARALRAGGPWGQGFPEPVFDGRFKVLARKVVGERHLRLTLQPEQGGAPLPGIAFNCDEEGWPLRLDQVHLAFRLDVNEYRAVESAQIVVEAVDE